MPKQEPLSRHRLRFPVLITLGALGAFFFTAYAADSFMSSLVQYAGKTFDFMPAAIAKAAMPFLIRHNGPGFPLAPTCPPSAKLGRCRHRSRRGHHSHRDIPTVPQLPTLAPTNSDRAPPLRHLELDSRRLPLPLLHGLIMRCDRHSGAPETTRPSLQGHKHRMTSSAAQQLDRAPSAEPALSLSKGSGDLRPIPASQAFGFSAILALAGRAAPHRVLRKSRCRSASSSPYNPGSFSELNDDSSSLQRHGQACYTGPNVLSEARMGKTSTSFLAGTTGR